MVADTWRPALRARGPALGIGVAVAAVGISLGLVWSVVASLRATARTGGGDLLAPAAGYTGAVGWSQPAAFVPLTIGLLVLALALLGGFLLRRRRLPALLVAAGGLAIALAVALPGSPLRDLLSAGGSPTATRLAGPFMPWMVAAFFVWAATLLFLAFASDRHPWAVFLYLLMWMFWIPPLVLDNMPSIGVTRPPVPNSGEAVDALNSRMAQRMQGLGQIPLENGSRVALSAAGAISMAPGLTADQAGVPQRFPVFDVKGAKHTGYLRTGTGDIYRNGSWESFTSPAIPFKAGDDIGELVSSSLASGQLARGMPAGSQPGLSVPSTGAQHAFQDSISITPPAGAKTLGAGPIPMSAFPTTAAFSGKFDPASSTITADKPLERAEWRAEVPSYSEAELQQAAFADAPAYTQLPPTVPQRVRDLAEDLTRFEKTPYNKARAIERYLKTNYEYGFADGATPQRGAPAGDPVDRFLFEDRKGTCGNFSSAFTVLARAAGIPARTVSGWAISPTDSSQTVRTDQAHQWAEVAFSPLGWVAFDPTPAAGTPGRAGDGTTPLPLARTLDPAAPESQTTPPEITPAAPLTSNPPAGAATGTPTPSRTPGAGGGAPLPIPPPNNLPRNGTSTPTAGITPTPAATATPPVRPPTPSPVVSPTARPGAPPATPGPAQEPVGTFNEITHIDPPRLRAGQAGTVTGRVLAEDGSVVTGPEVEIFLNTEKANGGILIGTGAAAGGAFKVAVTVPADLPVGKYQAIAHVIGNDRYAESWSDPEVEVFAGTEIRLRGPVDVTVGDAVAFTGTITTDGGVPIPGAVMTVRAEERSTSVTSGPRGDFTTLVTFTRAGPHQLTVDFPGTGLSLPRQASLSLMARDAVDLRANWPLTLRPGDALEVTGTLRLRSGKGVAGRPVRVAVEGTTYTGTVTTGSDGGFKWTQVLSDAGRRRLSISHETNDLLEAATLGGDFVVEAAPEGTGPNVLMIAGIAAGLAGGAAAGWAARTYVRRRNVAVEAPGDPGDGVTERSAPPEAQPPEATARITVSAPGIAPDLPAVWGIGDPLPVVASVSSADGTPLEDRAVSFEATGVEPRSARTAPDGNAGVSLAFPAIGDAVVTATTARTEEHRAADARLQLQIVDYRQEVVRLFNDFMDRHRKSASIAASVTPRDAEAVLVARALVTDEAALDALVTAFEEADYSEHTIARYHYERAYRAWKSLVAKPEVAVAPSTSRI